MACYFHKEVPRHMQVVSTAFLCSITESPLSVLTLGRSLPKELPNRHAWRYNEQCGLIDHRYVKSDSACFQSKIDPRNCFYDRVTREGSLHVGVVLNTQPTAAVFTAIVYSASRKIDWQDLFPFLPCQSNAVAGHRQCRNL